MSVGAKIMGGLTPAEQAQVFAAFERDYMAYRVERVNAIHRTRAFLATVIEDPENEAVSEQEFFDALVVDQVLAEALPALQEEIAFMTAPWFATQQG